MTEFSSYKPGVFCWVDLVSTDQEAAKSFYSQLFGWVTEDMETEMGPIYTMASIDGKSVAAIGQLPQEMIDQGVPPHWHSYVNVEDVDVTVAKAQELGATLIFPPMDAMDAGRMAMLLDPTGADFALWQAKDHIGAELANVPGTLAWNEHASRDSEKAKSFYTGLFGWQAVTAPVGDSAEYTSFMDGEQPRGGMMQMDERWPDDVPSHWMVYFAVESADATVEQAKGLGATTIMEPMDIPEVGRFAVIQDPQGAVFSVISLANPPA